MAKHFSIGELRVVLLEPSAAQNKLITAKLKLLGIGDIISFEQGSQALASLKIDSSPNLILSAMYLKDMTGIELLTQLRNNADTQDIAFVLISSETQPKVLEPLRQLGACAIIPKPFTSENLDHALCVSLDYLSEDLTLDQDDLDLDMLRVLLVDDSKAARNYMRKVLENLGVRNIKEAGNGHEGVQLLEECVFDLLITDYNMPEMDGKELIEFVRKNSWQSNIPILMVSSESDGGRLAAVTQAGVSGICDKPFEPSVVRGLLEKILREQQP
jgi:two-component system, chemotaxis family, chemotaxis protein CheY